ncbi:hypothetical protein F5144DRAFT_341007 [Chaetomium tenue]|uniref:Uncharacterized protein n=1 Tax=Chaetomium tenue TaxID=1854479 RepID=A0ACB7P2E3_9PEZI|nr:hypothetical protein F5144DRAFT_341007 [Chaetomium globosum]
MYRTNSQPPGCEGPHPQVQAKACLSSPRWARLRAFIRSTSAAARCLTPFPFSSSAISLGALHLLPLPSTGPPHWAVHGVSVHEGFLFYFAYCILHQSPLLVVSLCLAYITSASRPRPCLSLVYTSFTNLVSSDSTCLESFQPPVFPIALSTSFGFCKFHISPSSHFFLVLPIIFQRPQLSILGGTPMSLS